MSGQADSAPSLDDVAALLFENEGADSALEDRSAPETSTAPDPDNADEDIPTDEGEEPSPDETDPDSDEEDETGDDAPSQKSGELIEVTVKGADGADVTEKVTIEELKTSYMRHSDYTRKTMELGERERQAFEVVKTKLDEGRSNYMTKAANVHRAIVTLAALKSPEELAVLAQTDTSAYVQEKARAEAVQAVLQQIEDDVRAEAQHGNAQTMEQAQAEAAKSWEVLNREGLDRPKLVEVFTGIHEAYGVPKERLAKATDPALILIMRDAMKFRALDKRSKELKPVVNKAPPLPARRQPVPQETRRDKALQQKFRSGNAGAKDLASFILSHGG